MHVCVLYTIYTDVCAFACAYICVSVEEPSHSMQVEVRGQLQMSVLSFHPSLLLFAAAYTRLARPQIYLIPHGWQTRIAAPSFAQVLGSRLRDYYLSGNDFTLPAMFLSTALVAGDSISCF